VRLVLVLLLVYLAPLAAVAVLFHRDRFDFAAPITYGFFTIALALVLGAAWFWLRQPRLLHNDATAGPAPGSLVRAGLALAAALTGAWGLALFVTDRGPSPLVWAWPGDLLSSRLIAVMLLALAAGALFGLRHAAAARPMLAMLGTYGLGLAVASLWNALAGRPVPLGYLAIFGGLGLVSWALWLLPERQPAVVSARP
jgi:hypothetical protein